MSLTCTYAPAHLQPNSHIHMEAPVLALNMRPRDHRGLKEDLSDGQPIMCEVPLHDNTEENK